MWKSYLNLFHENIRRTGVLTLVASLLASLPFASHAQLSPVHNVQSPEVANLGVYGTIPVGHYTGVPEISIPLYEVKTGDFTLPISANYHLATVKPTQSSGCLGLGWSLSAGGYIARTVHGVFDEMRETNGAAYGFYSNAYRLKNITESAFGDAIRNHYRGNDFYELSADEFTFNFCGYTGTFFYNKDGGWTVISQQDIKVEFNPQDGEGFIGLDRLKTRGKGSMNLNNWAGAERHNRLFNKFTLIVPDGTRYEFGGVDATEYCIPYYQRDGQSLVPVSWKLSKVTTTDNRTVEFNYDASTYTCDLRYIPQKKKVSYNGREYASYQDGISGYTGFLLFPVYLTSIQTANEKLLFTYNVDYTHANRLHEEEKLIYWNTPQDNSNYLVRENIFNIYANPPSAQFEKLIKTKADFSSKNYNPVRDTLARLFATRFLHRIAIAPNYGGSYCVYFDYNSTGANRTKLTQITMRSGLPNLVSETATNLGKVVKGNYKLPKNHNLISMPTYSFTYNNRLMCPYMATAPTDSWGYSNGQSRRSITGQPANYQIRKPDVIETKAETLEEIKYPTGGKTQFVYELHDYGKKLAPDHMSVLNMVTNEKAGGLRVREIKNYDNNDSLLARKRYYYAETIGGRKSSGVSKGDPVLSTSYNIDGYSMLLESEQGFEQPITNHNTPDVGYSCVIEETFDGKGRSMGYTKYRYSNYDTDIFGNSHLDRPMEWSVNADGAMAPIASHAFERGKLLSKELYDYDGTLRRKTTYRYANSTEAPAIIAYQQEVFFHLNSVPSKDAPVAWLGRIPTCSSLPAIVRDTVFPYKQGVPFATQTNYLYNRYKQLEKETVLNFSAQIMVTDYLHPCNFGTYNWMLSRHIIEPVIQKTVRTRNKVEKTFSDYQCTDKGIPYLSTVKTSWGEDTECKVDYLVKNVNQYGKPTEIVKDGLTSTLYWGHLGQRLIAKIDNATQAEAEKCLGKEAAFSSASVFYDMPYRKFSNRHLLKNALFHIYQYDGKLRLFSETLPNGFTTYYRHDLLDRLVETFSVNTNGTFYDPETDELLPEAKELINAYDYYYWK